VPPGSGPGDAHHPVNRRTSVGTFVERRLRWPCPVGRLAPSRGAPHRAPPSRARTRGTEPGTHRNTGVNPVVGPPPTAGRAASRPNPSANSVGGRRKKRSTAAWRALGHTSHGAAVPGTIAAALACGPDAPSAVPTAGDLQTPGPSVFPRAARPSASACAPRGPLTLLPFSHASPQHRSAARSRAPPCRRAVHPEHLTS
jgi:hypothetical protein